MVEYQSRIDGTTVHIDEYQVLTLEYREDKNPFIADNLYRIGSEVTIQGGTGSNAYLNLAEVQIYADRLQKIGAESATQKDTYTDSSSNTYTADRCIDGLVGPPSSHSSICHTLSAPPGEEAWFQMEFSETHCFHVIQIVQHKTDSHSQAMTMNNAKIHVIDKITDKGSLCGTLIIREEMTLQGQIYAIECGQMSCGNLIKVSVVHQSTETLAIIHMREITAFVTTDCKRLPSRFIKTDSALPVTANTVLNLSCEDPYEIEGARQVTCNPGKPYSYGGNGQQPSAAQVAWTYPGVP
ncbi:uncharacterized protein LOC134811967 [Bolinopsis microptera]|uniref:uncharacterized protein LOC134811967 n=1 Tax=Bolinopsis microptera TaxID=2820187 RepID=UPI003078D2FF